MLFRSLILPGVLIPSAVAAAVLVVAAWLSKRRLSKSRRDAGIFGSGLAIAAAFLSAYVASTGWPRWLPVGSNQKLFYLVALAAVVTVVATVLRHKLVGWILGAGVIGGLLVYVLQPKLTAWSGSQSALWLGGLLVAGIAVYWAWTANLLSADAPVDLFSAAVRAGVVGGSAFVLGLSGSALLAQLAGAVACAVVVVELAGLVLKRRVWQPADAMVLATVLAGLLVIGFFYSKLEPWPAILLVLAYLLLALPGDRWWHRLTPLVPLAVALGIVVAAALTKEDDPYDYYSSLDPPPAVPDGGLSSAPRVAAVR